MLSDSERILDLIRERINYDQPAKTVAVVDAGADAFTPFQLPKQDQPNAIDRTRATWSLREMLAYQDRQFVHNAYLVLLRRHADDAGLVSRLESLRAGSMTRVEMLFRLRYGSEGKAQKVRVSGLIKAFTAERIYAIPVLGIIPRTIRAVTYLPQLQRDIREIKALLAMQKNDSDDKLAALIEFQNAEFSKRAKTPDNEKAE